ncbi:MULTISPECIES: lysis protein [Vibrio harveyi group]|uniref:lysis protein n=1 Tax=Vibrio harveyi group TaxID=717610 RepID=UPI00100F471E|nr:lysis protein [Vibrio parahaemolyticus]EHZ2727227.1 lysis protein [Vibrio parahaemolyticus]EIV1599951.1 lysis protein [Vibrio parahaemolyticus]MCZ5870233.1 lysis protein [Vibrio parahaemolyticus]MCZ5900549.1 lysis protein [Vibrio parahaemolyticus]MCZ6308873.1 lysis protein [Vibrio parahaemolyticus]
MKINFVALLVGVALCAVVYGQYERLSTVKSELAKANETIEAKQATIDSMKLQNQKVAALSQKKQQDLNDAKAEIERLERDVDAGRQRLRLNARCPSVPTNSGTASVDDESAPRLTRDAERAYFRLREQHALVTQQLTGLQEYIRALPAECIANELVPAR